jgi:hypothetical protein
MKQSSQSILPRETKKEKFRKIEKIYALNLKCLKALLSSKKAFPSRNIWASYVLSAEKSGTQALKVHDLIEKTESIFQISFNDEQAVSLIRASEATGIIYEVKGLRDTDVDEINAMKGSMTVFERCKKIRARAFSLDYHAYANDYFFCNLQGLDGDLPEMVAQLLLTYYFDQCQTVQEAVSLIGESRSLSVLERKRYALKTKRLLRAFALGMKANKLWHDEEDGMDRFVFHGDPANFFFFERTSFNDYLLDATRFEHVTKKRYNCAQLYSIPDTQGKLRTYLKLNVQMCVA